MAQKNQYDSIIIGSGIGGLTAAVLLTKIYKQKVLVLEQHFVPGGQTHEFMRIKNGKKYSWDVGIHYIGEMKKGLMSRKIFDFITNNKVEWQKMPYYLENFVYPDFSFKQASHPKEFQNDLISLFPDEKEAIIQYFKDLKKAANWFQKYFARRVSPKIIAYLLKFFSRGSETLALSTTKAYLDKNFKNSKLKALLVSIWGDYGVPPSKSAFVMHAIVVRSYLHGGYYPVGGASSIAKNMIPIIEKTGGKIVTNANVQNIIIKDNKAIGVCVNKKGKEEKYFAENIISDAGAYNTYLQLIPKEINIPFRNEIKSAMSSFSTSTLYLGLKESPEKLGIKGENLWIYSSYDHDQTFEKSKSGRDVLSAFVSFPSMKNPVAETHTAEIICFSHFDSFEKWKDSKWMKRGDEYLHFKKELSQKMLEYVEKYIPGLSDLVDYAELSTPLSMEYFTKWKKGSFYGIPATPKRYGYKWLSAKTPVKNLYLTGTDAASLGVIGAMMGGLITVSSMKGTKSFIKIMKQIEQYQKEINL